MQYFDCCNVLHDLFTLIYRDQIKTFFYLIFKMNTPTQFSAKSCCVVVEQIHKFEQAQFF